MASESWQQAWVEVLPDFSDFKRKADDEITGTLGAAGTKGGRSFSTGFGAVLGGSFFGNILSNVAVGIAGAIGSGIRLGIDAGFESIQLASSLGEQVNAVTVQFGDFADEILDLAKNAPRDLNLTQAAFAKLSVRFSSFAKTVAGEGGDASAVVQELTQRGADFASVYDIEVADALATFQSGLAGQSEPLRAYGLDLSEATVKQFAYANGIAEVGSELTEAEKIQARYGTLMEQTNAVTGDLANTSGSLSNQQRELAVGIEEAQTKLGQFLLPGFTAFIDYANSNILPKFGEIIETVGPRLGAALEASAPKVQELFGRLADAIADPENLDAFIEDFEELVGLAGDLADLVGPINDFFRNFKDFRDSGKNFRDDVITPSITTSDGSKGDVPWAGILGDLDLTGQGAKAAESLADGFSSGLRTADGWDHARDAAALRAAQIPAEVRKFSPEFYRAGAQGSEGIAAGIASGELKVGLAARLVAERAVAEVRKTFDSHSPSRVMEAEGENAIQGLIKGWTSEALPAVALPAVGVAESIAAVAPGASSTWGTDRPIFADGIGLIGWIRTLANGEARLVFNQLDGASDSTILGRVIR